MLSRNKAVLSGGSTRHSPDALWLRIGTTEAMREKLRNANPTLFCINDDEEVKDQDRPNLQPFLQTLFPEKADWELD